MVAASIPGGVDSGMTKLYPVLSLPAQVAPPGKVTLRVHDEIFAEAIGMAAR
jgi:hypothetical protein